ncbi:protein transporter tim10 [Naganishia adeliensis]|uniref:Protein transporter tim10 n=1 Tax=Naganishia adeliensis TaxID=92952 RepID=A0ACC2WQM5_9TREE|nr:protein transporter tim10 [Naganishia adeliensis]
MSFFGLGGGQNAQPTGAINPAQIEMAVAELDMITDVFNRLVNSCHAKCIDAKYHEPDLNKGEGVCIDRCTAKFFEVNKKVGERMQAMGGGSGGATFQ